MLPQFSVRKPYTVLVAVVLVLVLGVISFTGMTTDLLPAMELPYVVVMTTYPGASPEKIETTVTKPLEAVLGTTGGIKTSARFPAKTPASLSWNLNRERTWIPL